MRRAPTHRFSAPRRGFTLMELLVVMGIIILIAASALPAFRYITGAHSVNGATNIVDSMVGRSRSQAMLDFRTAGVFFYLDPLTDRTTMAMVEQTGDNFRDPDFYEYKGWTDGSDQLANANYTGSFTNPNNGLPYLLTSSVGPTGAITYYDSSMPANGPSFAMGLVQTGASQISTNNPTESFYANEQGSSGTGALFTKYTNIRFTYAGPMALPPVTNSNDPATASNAPPNAPPWNGLPPTDLDIVATTDVQVLPTGVAAQIINDTKGVATADKYLRLGAVLFDDQGKFASVPWTMTSNSTLAKLVFPDPGNQGPGGLSAAMSTDANGNAFYSGFGVVLYDRQQYLSQGFSESDYIYNKLVPALGGTFLWMPPQTTFTGSSNPAEQFKETWLDNNSLPLVVNRFNGALTKGE